MQDATKQLYQAFSQYSPQGIHHCDCGCINEEDVKRLAAQPLHLIGWEALGPYHGSALYTWGDLSHYKYYLPRILELYSSNRPAALIDLHEIYTKLKSADWLNWDGSETKAILNYLRTDWQNLLYHQEEVDLQLLEVYHQFFSVRELISLWDPNATETALKNYVYFFYRTGTSLLTNSVKTLTENEHVLLITFFKTSVSITKLEDHFYEQETISPEYAAMVSVVLQMLEQEKDGDKLGR